MTTADPRPLVPEAAWSSFDDGEDAVLLVHAQPGSASVWSRVGPQLAERGLDVLCVNRAGYRRTSGPALNQFGDAATMAGALDDRAGPPVVVVGHSLGAGTALALAVIAPEHVRALVLVAPAVGPAAVTLTDRVLGASVVGPALSWLGFRTAGFALTVPVLRRRILRDRAALSDADAREVVRRMRRGDVWRTFTAEQRYLLIDTHLLKHELPAVRCPVVVLTGSRDRVVRPRITQALLDGLAQATHLTTNAGHLLPIDAPDAVVSAILRTVRATADR
jgi:pimeloyl-ACP methyl ester carboxylesterase